MKDFTQGHEAKLIFFFSLPMLLGNVFQQMYNTVDSIIVGRVLGEDKLAAVGASFPIIFLLISLIMGITMGSTILISQFYGARDMERVKRAVDTAYVFLLIASIVLTIVGLVISEPILRLIHVPEEILPDAKTFLDIMFIGMIGMFGYNSISSILRGLGDSKTPLYFLIVSTLLNIILVLVFVLVFGWGVAGSAWATVIAQGVSFVGGLAYLIKTHPLFKFDLKNIQFDKDIFIASVKIGLPSGVQQMLVSIGMMSIQSLVNGFGTNTIAAYTAAGRLDTFAMMPAMNFSQAITSFVGQNIGAGKTERAKRGFYATVIMSGVISILISLLMIVAGREMMMLFNANPDVVDIGRRYLVIVSAFYVVFSTMFVINGLIRGTGHTIFTMLVTIGSLWLVRVPASTILARNMGPDGIWWGVVIGWIVGCAIAGGYYLSGKWKVPVTFKGQGTMRAGDVQPSQELQGE